MALERARRNLSQVTRSELNLLLVAECTAPGLTPLMLVKEELQQITEISDLANIHTKGHMLSPKVEEVSTAMQGANVLHLACHGVQSREDALQSGFCLRDGRLTIAHLMSLNLDKAFFAFLSACETAKGDQGQPDQTLHLAAAMLFAGFRSVLATMW
jgi:CHAT domain-containing protein